MTLLARAMAECSPYSFLVLSGTIILSAMLLERLITLFFALPLQASAFLPMLEKLIQSGNLERARKLAGQGWPGSETS